MQPKDLWFRHADEDDWRHNCLRECEKYGANRRKSGKGCQCEPITTTHSRPRRFLLEKERVETRLMFKGIKVNL